MSSCMGSHLGAAYTQLTCAYQDREKAALDWKAGGGKVIGCLGNDVPDELLLAAGFLPIRVYGTPDHQTAIADRYLELAFDPVARSKFNRLIDGSYSFLDYLVISNSTDVLVRLYYYLRELKRSEQDINLPPLEFIDLLFKYSLASSRYNVETLCNFKKTLESWRSRKITEEELHNAIEISNESRRLLRHFATLRGPEEPRVSGVQALVVIGASLFMHKKHYNHLLRELLLQAEKLPTIRGKRIFITGSVHEQLDFYELVESCGAVIVGEDHDWGNRHYNTDISLGGDLLKAISERYFLRLANPNKTFGTHRTKALIEEVQGCGAEGVIFYFRTYDEAATWDYPNQCKALNSLGISSKLFIRQPYKLDNKEELQEEVSEFLQKIDAKRGGTPNV